MRVENMTENWKKPELIILKKGEMQEAVLTHCKAVVISGDPEVGDPGQLCGNPKADSCQACNARPPRS